MARSRLRADARASSRLATFAQAMMRTRTTVKSIESRIPRSSSPMNSSRKLRPRIGRTPRMSNELAVMKPPS
jgi:hypothetical protein